MKKQPRTPYKHPLLIVITACLILLASAGGYWLNTREAAAIRESRYNELKAIAGLKSDQILKWRQERLSDARLYTSGLISSTWTRWIKTPEDASLKDIILKRMTAFKELEGYDDLILTGANGDVLMSVNPFASALDDYARQLIARVVSTNDVVFGDLFRCAICGRVHLDVVAPVSGPDGRPSAVLILRSDPEIYLFPLIQTWPTPSRSSETLIIRREGDDVLFLNTLRHHAEAAVLTQRIPLSETTNPTVQAALGRKGYFEGRDYRGVEVLADLGPIPGTPWFMEAKVDADEILAEVNSHRKIMILFICLFVTLTVAMAAFFYHYRERNLYLELFLAERKRREIQEELGATLYSIGDGVISTDTSGRIKRMNPMAEELTGWREADALGEPLERVLRIISEQTRAEAQNPVEQVLRENRVIVLANHTLLISRDGTERPIANSGAPIRDGKGEITGVVLVFSDQTGQKLAQKALAAKQFQLEELNRTLEERIQETVAELRQKDRILITQGRLAAMGEMIGNIAHQWRQPLNALGLVLFNIKDAFQFNTLDGAYLDQAVADGSRLVQKMSTTISDFSNFFRPDKKKRAFSALGQIREATALVASSFQNSDIAIHIDAPRDLKLMGFPNEYSQALLNLLSNAKEAILAQKRPQPHFSGRVDIAVTERGGRHCVTVSDNAGGIPEDILDKIFDPYFSTKESGTGIGLYMSKMIIECNMNGSITAKNIEGGAQFTVWTPLEAETGNPV
jgi:PAS domain S-box-containing protein